MQPLLDSVATAPRMNATRQRVLSVLRETPHALSHTDIQQALQHDSVGTVLDRVTLYRTLEWLFTTKLIHKIAGEDRVWRFSVIDGCSHQHHCESHVDVHQHSHFRCQLCQQLTCIALPDETQKLLDRLLHSLPNDLHIAHIELAMTGKCAACVSS
jgi:Fur family ferric uptake transcriptional regulator